MINDVPCCFCWRRWEGRGVSMKHAQTSWCFSAIIWLNIPWLNHTPVLKDYWRLWLWEVGGGREVGKRNQKKKQLYYSEIISEDLLLVCNFFWYIKKRTFFFQANKLFVCRDVLKTLAHSVPENTIRQHLWWNYLIQSIFTQGWVASCQLSSQISHTGVILHLWGVLGSSMQMYKCFPCPGWDGIFFFYDGSLLTTSDLKHCLPALLSIIYTRQIRRADYYSCANTLKGWQAVHMCGGMLCVLQQIPGMRLCVCVLLF